MYHSLIVAASTKNVVWINLTLQLLGLPPEFHLLYSSFEAISILECPFLDIGVQHVHWVETRGWLQGNILNTEVAEKIGLETPSAFNAVNKPLKSVVQQQLAFIEDATAVPFQ